MSEPDAPKQSLPVIGGADKVEQLKREFAADSSRKNLNQQSIIDRAIDPSRTPQQKAIEDRVIEALRLVYDPEIPVNIYDLGLIYEVNVAADNRVHVKMTLTAPGCPVAGSIVAEVEKRIESIEQVPSASVELVWEPPWSKEKMSEAALLELGLL